MVVNKTPLEAPFAYLYSHGIRFSTLLADWCKYAGYSRADIAAHARCADRSLKSCIQRDAAPTPEMRQAMTACIGFDPWALAQAIDSRRNLIRHEDLNTINAVRQQESDYSDSVDLIDSFCWPRIDDEDKL